MQDSPSRNRFIHSFIHSFIPHKLQSPNENDRSSATPTIGVVVIYECERNRECEHGSNNDNDVRC
jgi:hypothetical protein